MIQHFKGAGGFAQVKERLAHAHKDEVADNGVIDAVVSEPHAGHKNLAQDFPGGHVEPGEAFTDAVRREVKEETGLDIFRPTVCGIKDFIRDDGTRYIVMFFRADRFSGELKDSDEGRVFWIERDELTQYKLSQDFIDMVHVMENPSLTEFFYERDGENWKKRII